MELYKFTYLLTVCEALLISLHDIALKPLLAMLIQKTTDSVMMQP